MKGERGREMKRVAKRIKGSMVYSPGKAKPIVVVDGSSKSGFKKWRKTTIQPSHVPKKMTAAGLLVRG